MEYELYHSRKGTTWKSHKYTAKYIKNGKTIYSYGDYKGSESGDDDNTTKKDQAKKNIARSIEKTIIKGRTFISDILTKAKVATIKWKNLNAPTSDALKKLMNKKVRS